MSSKVEFVYGQYTRKALDQEYDNVKKTHDFNFKIYLDDLDEKNQSAKKKYARELKKDLTYGVTEEETLDLFITNPGGPLHIFYHGGYWRMLHKDDFTYVAHGILPHGHNLAIVNYALIPTVRMGELVSQCERSIRWLMNNADHYKFDAQQISVSGHSAGGHLAAMMATVDFPYELQSICAMSGIFDLEPIQKCFLNAVLELTDQEILDYSPARLTPHFKDKLILLTGAKEGPEYERQARELQKAWSVNRPTPQLVFLPEHDHFTLRGALSDPDSEITKLALAL